MKSQKQKTVECLRHTYCRLKPSPIGGVGVFAVRDIPKGENPFLGIEEKLWVTLSAEEINGLEAEIRRMVDDFFVIEKDGSADVPQDGLNGMNISFFVNHSKTPNLRAVGDGSEREISFVAVRTIAAGEELTVSYASYDHKYQ